MSADPTVVVATITAGGALLAHPITWVLARRNHRATAELTEVQAEQLRTQIWTQLQTSLNDQVARLQRQLADVSARLATVEMALVEKSAQLRATELERDRLREERAALVAEVAELRAQLAACRSCTIRPAPTGGTHP